MQRGNLFVKNYSYVHTVNTKQWLNFSKNLGAYLGLSSIENWHKNFNQDFFLPSWQHCKENWLFCDLWIAWLLLLSLVLNIKVFFLYNTYSTLKIHIWINSAKMIPKWDLFYKFPFSHILRKNFDFKFLEPPLVIMMIIWFKKSSHTRITIDIFWNASWNNRGAEIGELGVLSFRFTRKFLQKQFLCGTKYSLPAFLILQFLQSTFWIMLSLKRLNNGIVLFKWYGNLRL